LLPNINNLLNFVAKIANFKYNLIMKKIWSKIIKDNKIKKDFTLSLDEFSIDNLYEYLKDICYNLKIETPIILPKHLSQLEEYNMTRFTSGDFIDFIEFDSLMIEYYEDD